VKKKVVHSHCDIGEEGEKSLIELVGKCRIGKEILIQGGIDARVTGRVERRGINLPFSEAGRKCFCY